MITNRRRFLCWRKKYRPSCVYSKGAVLVLMMCFILFTIAAFLLTITLIFHGDITRWIYGISSVFCIVYPFLGLLGEKWCRFKVILIGVAIVFVSVFILALGVGIGMIVINDNSDHVSIHTSIIIPSLLGYIFYLIGMCIFQANIIQFGTDQIQFAPSKELSSFVHWLFWVQALANVFVGILTYIIVTTVSFNNVVNVSIAIGVITAILGILYVCFILIKRYLVIEPAQHNNPVILIWSVMRYAWKHKQPVRRSAFTYGEPLPSRLDLGKERYGGPFTTLQVEDVKSFFHIIPVIFAIFCFSFQDSKITLQNLYLSSNSTVFMEKAILFIPNIIPCSVVALSIFFHQFLIAPFQFCFFLSMLKRIWLGLVMLLLELVVLTIFQYFIDNATNSVADCIAFENQKSDICVSPYYIFILSQILQGISMMLVFIGSLEFILAQAPRSMQGLLIGLWLMQYYGIWNFDAVILAIINNNNIYTAVKTGFVFISVIIYTIAAYKYKYRQRNELSDVNERVIITQYTERQLDRMELLNDDISGQTSVYIISEDVL